ncbi:ATP-binding cassette domain-containing protein [Acidimicrobiaceae bacterium USS-CC1]|uniref:ATP-binding cassette domain-containing protein n=1 Tax=Acidiferrimicrobium australe TaxID=2664430 RepID=A0ABW9QWA6_9ACTN|nr:ATP-binding cassette domain-containing protein [Acidiferrimicrobium australe]
MAPGGLRARPSGLLAIFRPRRTWELDLRPVRAAVGAGVALSAARACLQWIAPVPLKLVFDSVLGHHPLPGVLSWMPTAPTPRLLVLTGAMVVIALLLGLTAFGATAFLASAGQRVVHQLRCRLFAHLSAQSRSFHQRHAQGDLLSRLGGDVQAMQSVVVNVVPVVAENTLTIGGMVAIMLVLDWQFSLLALGMLPVLVLVVRHYLAVIREAQREARRAEGDAITAAQQILTALPVVQASGTEELEVARYGGLAARSLAANRRAVVLQSRFTPLVAVVMTCSTALVTLVGAREVLAGRLTAGDLLLFAAYFRAMYSPARQLAKLAGMLGRGQASAERVSEMLRIHDEVPKPLAGRRPPAVRGRVTFDGVTFAHGEGAPVLADVRLDVEPGERRAFVGATGAGKSTLLRLVPRFADVTTGAVRLDGTDVRQLDLDWLRQQIAWVPQDLALLRSSLWENIVYGSRWTSRSDAVAAARAAGVHEVIAALRDGYDTDVGEAGGRLSGGQRQCVALARAMAREAPILLLDEPTAGLDASTRSVVGAALDRLSEGRTTLLVTHHLQAVADGYRISVLCRGRIIEDGTHRELVGSATAYRQLYLADVAHGDDEPRAGDAGPAQRLSVVGQLRAGSGG